MGEQEKEEEAFWSYCAQAGVVSKKLALRRHADTTLTSVSVVVAEPVRYGSPVIAVPYGAVLNGQTLRGDLLPPTLPSFTKMTRLLTRRAALLDAGVVSGLWLAAFIATCRHTLQRGSTLPCHAFAPLLARSLQPPLPTLFTPEHAAQCPCLADDCSQATLRRREQAVEHHLTLVHAILRRYSRRHQGAADLTPSRSDLTQAYRTVMQRALPLPINCAPSAPDELAELLAASPQLPLLTSLVPAVDLIRAVTRPAATRLEGDEVEERQGNCALYTCVHSDFTCATTRRRVIVETAPYSARRVVVCATRDLQSGDELLLEYE